MKKKVAVITGASSGMGMETALELLNRGFCVYGGARRVEAMQTITKHGGFALPLDLTSEASMTEFVGKILEREGRIDVLVNNAGYGSCGTIEDIPMEEVRNQYEVNVFGLGRMIQLVLPAMRKQGGGKIVNIASMGGRFTTPFGGWYHSTKYAVESISDALRMETLPDHIDTIVIEPGMIKTNWGVIAAENIRKYSGNTSYSQAASQAARYYEARYQNTDSTLTNPKKIAEIIGKAVTAKHPRTRYLVGKYSRLFTFLKWILPDRCFQSMARLSMGI